jgi:hypothetical protein
VDPAVIYNILQTGAYGVMAVLIMRLKLFLTPHLCILAALLASPKYIPFFTSRQVGASQCCGSGSVSGSGLDPDSIGSVNPDPDSGSGSGSRRAKMTHKSRIFFRSSCFEVLDGLF